MALRRAVVTRCSTNTHDALLSCIKRRLLPGAARHPIFSTSSWRAAVQVHTFTSDVRSGNPYRVLNVPINSSYETVKAAFLKAALQHHPDHSKQADTAAFIRVRQAFEEIVASPTGVTARPNRPETAQTPQTWRSDAEFQDWFRQATGEYLAFDMNHDTRQEVIRTYRTMSMGGRHKGGYWELARQLAEREDAVHTNRTNTTVERPISPEQATPVCPSTNLRRKRNR